MTTDLDRLIEAVEEGDDAAFRQYNRAVFATPAQDMGLQLREDDSYRAYRGSIDAAVALLEALLPGWTIRVTFGGKSLAHAHVFMMRRLDSDPVKTTPAAGDTPARALLLATLRAYRSTKETTSHD